MNLSNWYTNKALSTIQRSTNFDHDHGRNFKITMVKWSKFWPWPRPKSKFSMVKMVDLDQIWSKMPYLTIDYGANSKVSMVMVKFFDHWPNSGVLWSWSVPYPPPYIVTKKNKMTKHTLYSCIWRWSWTFEEESTPCRFAILVLLLHLRFLSWNVIDELMIRCHAPPHRVNNGRGHWALQLARWATNFWNNFWH